MDILSILNHADIIVRLHFKGHLEFILLTQDINVNRHDRILCKASITQSAA